VTWVASEDGACSGKNRDALPRHPGLRLQGVHFLADVERLHGSGADYLVMHLNPPRELAGYRPDGVNARRFRRVGAPCVSYAMEHFGKPVFHDEDLVVFDLKGQPPGEPPAAGP
jgi:hypothetical protein